MKIIFKLIITAILYGFSALMMAQQTVTAYLLDSETKKPIDLVAVVSSTSYTITNTEGGFTLRTDTNDTIQLSHISYLTQNIPVQQLSNTVFLQPKVHELQEIVVVPRAVIVRELTAVWDKYNRLLKNKKDNNFLEQTFYYRQLTRNDELHTEYMECFFTAPTTVSVRTLSLQEGRFARIKKDSIDWIRNFFRYCNIRPFSTDNAATKMTINPLLVKDFEKYYDIHITQIISPEHEDEVKVYQFIPYQELIGKDKNAVMPSGLLYIRTKDLSIIRLEASTNYTGLRGIPNVKNEKCNFTVTYREGIESYPIAESVKCEAEIEFLRNEQSYQMKVYSVLFAADHPIQSKGRKMKRSDALLKIIAQGKYNQEFWDNNPMIKRTQIEQQVLDDFNRLGYFGTIQFDE